MTTPLLGISEISAGVENQATIHNTGLRQFEARSFRVLSMVETTPAVGAAESDSYIIPAGATGVWAGLETQIASWIGGAWSYYEPAEGLELSVVDELTSYTFYGSAWVASGGSGATAPFSDSTTLVKGSVDATKRVRIEVDGLTTATTRVYTAPDKDGTLAMLDDVTGETLTSVGALINSATSKATPVDADFVGLMDSAASNILAKLSWANVKATLKTYFDTLYTAAVQPFDVHAFYPGVPSASAKVLRIPVARAVTFLDDFSGSYGVSSVAATASTAFDVQKNGVSVGTITFAAAASVATFVTSGTTVVLAAGDVISIIAPASADATLADVGLVLAGTR